jgi:uncharacterized membrane protein
MATTGTKNTEKGAADYGREALAQWSEAARLGMRALAARRAAGEGKPGLGERLDPTRIDKGGKAGDVADLALSKLGAPGRLAAKVKMGSRLVDRFIGPEDAEPAEQVEEEVAEPEPEAEAEPASEGDGAGAGAPLPIQGSIDVALPVAAVFELCTRFEEYPQMIERVSAVEVEDDTHFTVLARAGKAQHRLSIELVGEEAEERLDWECAGELEHSGVLTVHPLAPRLTRLEMTIERDSEGPLAQLARVIGLPERALRQELRRFKAVAELWEEGKRYEPSLLGPVIAEEEEEEEEELPDEEEEANGSRDDAAV